MNQDLTVPLLPDGSEYLRADGGVMIMQRNDTLANSKGYIQKHRWVMSRHLGRPLEQTKTSTMSMGTAPTIA